MNTAKDFIEFTIDYILPFLNTGLLIFLFTGMLDLHTELKTIAQNQVKINKTNTEENENDQTPD